ncbi:hypothetical protein Tco_0152787 [Tanacetum coccineum]
MPLDLTKKNDDLKNAYHKAPEEDKVIDVERYKLSMNNAGLCFSYDCGKQIPSDKRSTFTNVGTESLETREDKALWLLELNQVC